MQKHGVAENEEIVGLRAAQALGWIGTSCH
jgi:hypothetical protein